jgi:hypothetical protein
MRRLIVLVLLVAPSVALAQGGAFEITPFVGYRWGGEIHAEDIDLFQADVEVAESEAFGLAVDIPVVAGLEVELLASRQSTELVEDQHLFNPSASVADVDITYYHVGVLYQWNTGKLSPYITGSLGVGVLDVDAPQVRNESELSGSFGGGLKLYMTPNVGLRFELRGVWTDIGQNDSWDWEDCEHHEDCWHGDWNNLAQTQASVGLILAF